MGENTIDAVVTDPPYGLSFMGKEWDHGVPGIPFWQETLRVCKPGAHMLAFGGTRTHHRLTTTIEDAGWEIRDCLMWVYGSGFPKSLDVSKAIDKAAGAEREVVGKREHPTLKDKSKVNRPECSQYHATNEIKDEWDITSPTTPAAIQWNGWGTALKPAWEPIILCRKPLEGTVANNVQKWGTGAINIDGCRVATDPLVDDMMREVTRKPRVSQTWENGSGFKNESNPRTGVPQKGRFPANFIHDGSDEVLGCFPNVKTGNHKPYKQNNPGWKNTSEINTFENTGDSGSSARFFYCAKASTSERNVGLSTKNTHPTVKPVKLLQYLCKLITPPNGVILDPFSGSGSTGISASNCGFDYILIEVEEEYCKISNSRNSTTNVVAKRPLVKSEVSEWW